MLHAVEHAAAHTIEDSVLVILILFLTYLAMEYLEHGTGGKLQLLMRKSGRLGPVVGALAGVVPQCGFSAAASNLYAGRVITMGTLRRDAAGDALRPRSRGHDSGNPACEGFGGYDCRPAHRPFVRTPAGGA